MSKEGENWRISKERKEEERRKEIDKHERLETASRKKEAVRTKQKCKELQTRITDEKMPRNRKMLIEMELERKRIFLMKEAKQELWKKWRQNKGRIKHPKLTKNENSKEEELEEKLRTFKIEVENYEEEERELAKTKKEGFEKKERKERYWEMLRWVVTFIDENKEYWEELKKQRKLQREQAEKG